MQVRILKCMYLQVVVVDCFAVENYFECLKIFNVNLLTAHNLFIKQNNKTY